MFYQDTIKTVSINDIDRSGAHFKISRNIVDDRLVRSVEKAGLLEPLIAVKNKKGYELVFGHNRLGILKDLNRNDAEVALFDSLAKDEYVRLSLIKSFRNEIGPVGKLKLIGIIRDFYNCDEREIIAISRQGLNVPAEFIRDQSLANRVLQFPERLRDYIDYKDIGFRIIKNCSKLSDDVLVSIDRWLWEPNMRVNIFKDIVDFLLDMSLSDDGLTTGMLPADTSDYTQGDFGRWDEYLHNRLFSMRYPRYCDMSHKSQEIIENYKREGVVVKLPPYFEGDEISISWNIKKEEDLNAFSKKLREIDWEGVQELLGML